MTGDMLKKRGAGGSGQEEVENQGRFPDLQVRNRLDGKRTLGEADTKLRLRFRYLWDVNRNSQ